jgi:hypothetical protein
MDTQPTQSSIAPSRYTGPFSHVREWQWGWLMVVLANVPVPLIFGCLVTANGGLFGMLEGVVVVWLCGHFVVARIGFVRCVLVPGGVLVALSQVIPVLQIGAGSFALQAARPVGRSMTEVEGFLVTLLTAGQLVVVALVCGLGVRAMGLVIEGRIHRGRY